MYNGVNENTVGTCSELIFAPIDASFSDDSPLQPSGFRIIPIDSPVVSRLHPRWDRVSTWSTKELNLNRIPCICQDTSSPNCTLDLASTLEVGTPRSRIGGGSGNGTCANSKAVMTIAFQFAFESHLQDNVAAMARQYMRSIISSVQRIALALSSSHLVSRGGIPLAPVSPEATTLSRWICQSYRFVVCSNRNTSSYLTALPVSTDAACLCRFHFGAELIKSADTNGSESVLKDLWHHASAILCFSLKVCSTFLSQSLRCYTSRIVIWTCADSISTLQLCSKFVHKKNTFWMSENTL